jgi:spoIIIJ-associated protein
MKEIEATGRTAEEAVQKALSTLGIKRENADVDIISEPAQGLLSFIGSKNARVLVKMHHTPAQYLEQFLQGLLELMVVQGKITVQEDEEKITALINGKRTGILIGRRGKTLNDLQYLANTVMRRQFESLRKIVIVDVENYRARREQTLIQLAKSIARKVSIEGLEQALEPMTPQERRIIHLALQEHDAVVTYSRGEEPYRKVIIAPR